MTIRHVVAWMSYRGIIKVTCLLLLAGGLFVPTSIALPETLQAAVDLVSASGLWSLFLLILTIRIAEAAGLLLLRKVGWPIAEDPLEGFVFAVALGLGVLGTIVFALGVLHLFQPLLVRVLFFTAAVVTLFSSCSVGGKISALGPANALALLLVAYNSLWLGVYLLAAAAPETGFDALNYHLGVPRLYLAEQGIIETPNVIYSYFPFLTEMLYTLGLLIDSPILAVLFHFFLGMLCALGILSFGRRYFSFFWGLFGSALFLSSPIVGFLMQTAYADLSLALYSFLAFYAFLLWRDNFETFNHAAGAADSGVPRHAYLITSGLFAGLAFAVKYTGILVPGVITVATALHFWRIGQSRLLLSYLSQFHVMVLVFASPWLIKNLVLTWNPVAPLLADILPLAALQPSDYYQWLRTTNNWGGYAGSLWDYLKTPWLLTVENNVFMGRPGPIIFPGAILAVILGWRRPEMRPIILLGSTLFFLCLLTSKLVRYHTLSFPFLCLIIAGALWSLNPARQLSKVQTVLAGGVLLLLISQLPWFLPLSGSTLNTVDRAKIRIFLDVSERWQFFESKLLGQGGQDLYRTINQGITPGKALLAITPGYQSLIDHPVYMAPNSSQSIMMTEKLLDYGLAYGDLVTLKTQVSSMNGRHWEVSLPVDRLGRPTEFYRPRFYFESSGGYLEMALFAIRRSVDGNQLRIECDLGASRRVDQIRLWSPRSDDLEVGLNCRSRVSGELQNPVAAEWRRIPPDAVSMAELLESLNRFDVEMILYPLLPELSFIDEAFRAPENARYFEEVFRTDTTRLLRVLP